MIAQQIESAGITGKPKNLEEQAIQLVGTDIYRKLIAGYTQKQWGKPPRELPSFIIRSSHRSKKYVDSSRNGPSCQGTRSSIDR